MGGIPAAPRYQSADFERVPWTAVVPAVLCAGTALISAVSLAIRVWQGFGSDSPVTFYAIPTVFFDGAPQFALASYLIIAVPWIVATLAACRRLFFPRRDAHRSLAILLVPAVAFNIVAYASIVSAGKSFAEATVPFGLWLLVGAVCLPLLGSRKTRRFGGSLSAQQTPWRTYDLDDGT